MRALRSGHRLAPAALRTSSGASAEPKLLAVESGDPASPPATEPAKETFLQV